MVTNIYRYFKIYLKLFRFALIESTTYRISFFIEVIVESGYDIAFLIFFQILFSNITQIGDWDKNQIMFLNGINIITSELILGIAFIFGIEKLPQRIKNGEVDVTLLKPLNSMFSLTLAQPYYTSFIASIAGLIIAVYYYIQMKLEFSLLGIVSGTYMLILGLILGYTVCVTFASLSFKYVGNSFLVEVIQRAMLEFKYLPHPVYKGILRFVFFLIIPAVFISSVPAETFFKGPSLNMLILSTALTILWTFIAIKMWNRMIVYYTGASS